MLTPEVIEVPLAEGHPSGGLGLCSFLFLILQRANGTSLSNTPRQEKGFFSRLGVGQCWRDNLWSTSRQGSRARSVDVIFPTLGRPSGEPLEVEEESKRSRLRLFLDLKGHYQFPISFLFLFLIV